MFLFDGEFSRNPGSIPGQGARRRGLPPRLVFDGTRSREERAVNVVEIIQAFSEAAFSAYYSGQCLPMWMP